MITRVRSSLVLACIGLFSLVACQPAVEEMGQEISIEEGHYRLVSVQELQAMLESKDFTMINVHTPWQGDISGTDLRLAYDQIEQNLGQLPEEKETKIVVYCLTTGMAKKAVSTLLGQGYTNLWMLEGGTTAWEEAGLDLEKQ